MPREPITHLSPEDQKSDIHGRIAWVSTYFGLFLFGSGVLTFIILHVLQAYDPQRFTSPDWSVIGIILLGPCPIAIMFCLTSLAIVSLVRSAKLDILGREVIVKPVARGLRKIDENVEAVCTVEFETPDGVHHHVELVVPPGVSDYASTVRIRYDPLNLSNAVFIPDPPPIRRPVRALFGYCGCGLPVTLMLLGVTIFMLVLCVGGFIFPPVQPSISPPGGP